MQKNVEEKFIRIIKGELKYTSDNLAVNLLLSRLIKKYHSNPQSEAECLKEINDFSVKYTSFMNKEYEAISAL